MNKACRTALLFVVMAPALLACERAPTSSAGDATPAPASSSPSSAISPISSIDPKLQTAAETELASLGKDPTTLEASVVAIDPRNGELRAMAGWAMGAPAPTLPSRAVYLSGSVAKVFSVAAAHDAGVVTTSDRFSGADRVIGDQKIEGSKEHPSMTVEDVLVFSSNVGSLGIYDRVGKQKLHDSLVRFGFGERPNLPGAVTGELGDAAAWSERDAASIAYGNGLKATPLQYSLAFAAVAAGGQWHPVSHAHVATPETRQAMSPEKAKELLHLMESVVHRDDGTGTKARVAGQRVSGKTGTASLGDGISYASFVGAVPAAAPELVIYVGVKTSARGYSGGTIAAPAFAHIVERGLPTN